MVSRSFAWCVLAVAGGFHHWLILSEAGKVYSCGNGQLGHGDMAFQFTPRIIAGLQDVQIRSIAAGGLTSLAVTTDGELYGWGTGAAGYEEGFEVASSVLGLELIEDQLVPHKYPGLRLNA